MKKLHKKKTISRKEVVQNKTDNLKNIMLQMLSESMGVVSEACRKANITRETFYKWKKEDDTFRKAVEDVDDIALDFGESALHKRISEGSDTAIIFYLKTKGKRRGYIERSEVTGADGKDLRDVRLIVEVINVQKPLESEREVCLAELENSIMRELALSNGWITAEEKQKLDEKYRIIQITASSEGE